MFAPLHTCQMKDNFKLKEMPCNGLNGFFCIDIKIKLKNNL